MEPQASPSDITDISSNHAALQQMYELETIQWRGGDLFWDGPHNSFCFVCGGSMDLFGCQTCDNCYHAECMSPTLNPDTVPKFWFCPHCVDRELHIPPDVPKTYFTPVTVPGSLNSQADYFSPVSLPGDGGSKEQTQKDRSVIPHTPLAHPSDQPIHKDIRENLPSSQHVSKTENHLEHVQSDRISRDHLRDARPDSLSKYGVKRGRPKRSMSPPKKKSKYSLYSTDVEKALGVLHAELQKAAENGRSEGHLQGRVQDLEQELKLQSGQLALVKRELELAKKSLSTERFKYGRYVMDSQAPKQEIIQLKELLAKKDAELKDWRSKLKSMLGTDMS